MANLENIISNDILNKVKENIYVVLKRSMMKFHTNMPAFASANGVYDFEEKFYDDWHVGFWAGIYYIAHEMFGDRTFLHYAESITDTLQEKTLNNTIWESPDEGLIYMPSCINSFKINRDFSSIETLCKAADRMVESHLEDDGQTFRFAKIQSSYVTNLNLIRLVAKMSNNERYLQFADTFEDMILKNNIHDDGNCVMYKYVVNGDIKEASEYAFGIRGNAWMLHGLVLRYASTGDEKYMKLFQKVASYFFKYFYETMLSNVSEKSSELIPDTTSMSMCNCAIMEFLKGSEPSNPLAEGYINLLKYNLNFIISDYLISCEKNSQGLISGGVLMWPATLVNGSNIMGDYFFMESLMHLDSDYRSCWDIDYFIKSIRRTDKN